MIETLTRDVRYGVRSMTKSPRFTLAAVLSLALGIGANTAIFTLIDAVMLRSLPVQSPTDLFSVGDPSRPTALRIGAPMLDVFSYPLYLKLRDQNRVFSGLLASGKAGRVDMTVGSGAPEQVQGRLVSGNYFDVLGLPPAMGRVFSPEDDRAGGASPVIVISHSFWQQRFAGDPGILGRIVKLNALSFTVVGVAPAGFSGDVTGIPTDAWIPLTMQPQINRGDPRLDSHDANWLLLIGRRLPGVTIERVHEEMTTLAHRTLADFVGPNFPAADLRALNSQRVQVEPGAKGFTAMRRVSQPLLTLLVVVGLLLLIACANVANLLLARATSRRKEMSLRLAMGASRLRLIRQLLTESLLLAALGGSAGWLLAGWGSRSLRLVFSAAGPMASDAGPSPTVLAFTAGLSLLTAILFGLIPALGSTRVDLAPALKENARTVSGGGMRLGKLLVAAQLGLSLLLLIGAGLFIRSLANASSLDVGYSRANLILLKQDLAGSGFATPAQQFPLLRALIERLASLPGVAGVTVSENGIFSGTDSDTEGLQVEGFTPVRKQDSSATFDQVGPHYFQVVGVPVLSGRDFDEHDTATSPFVAIVNDTMARFYFGDRSPLGKSLANGSDHYTIVGVVRDMKERDLKSKTERRFYTPLFQSTDRFVNLNLEIRTRGHAALMLGSVRREMQSLHPDLKIVSLEPVRVLIDRSISQDRLIAQLSGFFAVLALLLAANGVYGVMSYAMSRRANEIGIRMALGAGRSRVIRMVLRETLGLAALGFAIGLPAAMLATRLIATTLVGLSPADPLTLTCAALILFAIAIFAAFIPALRAARIDPALTLRQE